MLTTRLTHIICWMTLLATIFTACTNAPAATTSAPIATEAKPSSTVPSPSPTAEPTTPVQPTPLPPPAPTATLPPQADLPTHLGQNLPAGTPPLSSVNAGDMALLGLWGLGQPQGLAWFADGTRLAVGFQAGILVFDTQTGQEIYRIRSAGWIAGMALLPDEQILAVLHANGDLEFYNAASGERMSSLLEIVPHGPLSLQVAPDGQSLLVGLKDGVVSLVTFEGSETSLGIFGDGAYPVENLAVLPGQPRLVGMSSENGMSVWSLEDLGNPSFLYHLPGTTFSLAILGLAASPDGHWLAASNWDEWLTLWDVSGAEAPTEGQMLWEIAEGFDPPSHWNALAFSPNSQVLASGADDGKIWLWDIASTKPFLAAQVGGAPIQHIAYAPDGNTLATVHANGQVLLLDSGTLGILLTLQTGAAWAGSLATISADGQSLATASWAYPSDGPLWGQAIDGAGLYLRSPADGRVVQQMNTTMFEVPPSGFSSLGLSPDGSRLAASPLGWPLSVWDTSRGEMAFPLMDTTDELFYYCSRVLYAPDGQSIAAACGYKPITLWQAETGAYWQSLEAITDEPFTTLAFSPDSAWLAAAGGSGPVNLWALPETAPSRLLAFFEPAPITDLFFSPDGQYLACTTGRDYPKLVIWDLATGEVTATLGFNDRVTSAAFSPDGQLLAVAVDFEFADVLEIWDWQNQELLAYERYYSGLMQVFFTPDGRLVFTVSQDGLIHIWGASPE